jgi:hypothetical protein
MRSVDSSAARRDGRSVEEWCRESAEVKRR